MQTFHTFVRHCCSTNSWGSAVAQGDTDSLRNVPPSVLLLSVWWNKDGGRSEKQSEPESNSHTRGGIKIKQTKIIEMGFSYWSLGDESLVGRWFWADWHSLLRPQMLESFTCNQFNLQSSCSCDVCSPFCTALRRNDPVFCESHLFR